MVLPSGCNAVGADVTQWEVRGSSRKVLTVGFAWDPAHSPWKEGCALALRAGFSSLGGEASVLAYHHFNMGSLSRGDNTCFATRVASLRIHVNALPQGGLTPTTHTDKDTHTRQKPKHPIIHFKEGAKASQNLLGNFVISPRTKI